MNKNYWKIIFAIYIVMLINFVVVKFNGNVYDTVNTIQMNIMRSTQGGTNYNFVPFKTIETYLSDLSFGVAFVNIVGNIIPFIPMGFLIPMVFRSQRKIIKTMFTCLLLITSIECIQFFAYLGSFDIDDILLDIISCVLGFCVSKCTREYINELPLFGR